MSQTQAQLYEQYQQELIKSRTAEMEENVLDLWWNKYNILDLITEHTIEYPKFSFYQGPPFATGDPHYGHTLGETIKSMIVTFMRQSGFYVPERYGFDEMGL